MSGGGSFSRLDYAERWLRDGLAVLRPPMSVYQATFDMTIALERLDVAGALSARRLAGDRQPLECYVQVNLAGEPTKAGVAPDALGQLLEALAAERHDGIAVVGLMAMPPLARDPEDSRPWFRQLASLAAEHGCQRLSMGTSADFEVAVEEGATAVRLGAVLVEGAEPPR